MKKLAFLALVFIPTFAWTQNKNLGIGINTPNTNAVLHVESPTNNQGIIIPRLTTLQRTSLNATLNATDIGLIIFDSDLRSLAIWNGTSWDIGSKTGDLINIQNASLSGTAASINNLDGNNTSAVLVVNSANASANAIETSGNTQTGSLNVTSGNFQTNGINYLWPAVQNSGILMNDGTGNLTWGVSSGSGDLLSTNNLSDLTDVAAARINLGLGPLAELNNISSVDISDNSIQDADIFNGAAISGSKINPTFGAQALSVGLSGEFNVNALGNITKVNGA